MRDVQASEAKTHLPGLLREVEAGASIAITRHGRRIARLVPEPGAGREDAMRAAADLKAMRRRTGRASLAEILSWRHEGHRY